MKLLLKRCPTCVFVVYCCIFCACSTGDSRKNYSDSDMYNFSHPKVLKLPADLDEISGIAYYPKDTSVFAIVDEDGMLYKIPLKNPQKLKKWKFDKKRDYEDIVLHDSTFFVLVSNGDIVELKFNGDKIAINTTKFSAQSDNTGEFEILYKSPDSSIITLICKDCQEDSKQTLTSYNFNTADSAKSFARGIVFDMAPLMQKLGIEKHLKPSAAAINPITKELYIISSIQKLVVIMDANGAFKEFYKLNPIDYKQPEGIAFTPAGDLIISNEFAEDGFATLLLLKNKKK